ncbi:MAG: hypothetical protein H6718_03980 [Polyangiaceae bacterium]|nr:hypothetical protein [Myxococcales bacterium]MCB9584527.1 hypothetical protein [Polyangiaceae bacterium]
MKKPAPSKPDIRDWIAILEDIRVQQDNAPMAQELERCSFVDAREISGVRWLKLKPPPSLYGQKQAEAALREAGARLFGGFDVEFVKPDPLPEADEPDDLHS